MKCYQCNETRQPASQPFPWLECKGEITKISIRSSRSYVKSNLIDVNGIVWPTPCFLLFFCSGSLEVGFGQNCSQFWEWARRLVHRLYQTNNYYICSKFVSWFAPKLECFPEEEMNWRKEGKLTITTTFSFIFNKDKFNCVFCVSSDQFC